MATVLKQVLDKFDDPGKAASLSQIAHELEIDMPTLQGMIDYWVRKGKLREVVQCESSPVCACCGPKTCPFVVAMPRGYELVPVIAPEDIHCRTPHPLTPSPTQAGRGEPNRTDRSQEGVLSPSP